MRVHFGAGTRRQGWSCCRGYFLRSRNTPCRCRQWRGLVDVDSGGGCLSRCGNQERSSSRETGDDNGANAHLRPRGSSSLRLSTYRLAAGHSQSKSCPGATGGAAIRGGRNQRTPSRISSEPTVAATLQSGGISIFRLAEGRIAEYWQQLDRLALMQQLGVVPAPGARPARQATGESRR